MKFYVNIPRYRRQERGPNKEVRNQGKYDPRERKNKVVRREVNRKKYKEVWKEKKVKKSFAEVVRGISSQALWKRPIIETEKQVLPWMEASAIGQFNYELNFYQVL